MMKGRIAGVGAIVIGGVLAFYLLVRPTKPPQPVVPAATPAQGAAIIPPASVPAPTPAPSPMALDRLPDFVVKARDAKTADAAQQLLDEIRRWLRSLPPAEALAAIRRFLDSGEDVAVPLDFTLQADGSLKAAPTLRVWLLNCLTLVAPSAAAEYAQQLLASSNSPDEWAAGLRAYGIGRPEDSAYLKAKAGELLARADWRAQPSSGYLEAFDVLVHTRATEFAPQLATLVKDKENRAIGHAAFLTLDRLVQQDPVKVLKQLQAEPELMSGREQTRANYFARADVRDFAQRALLETYLLDPRRTPAELDTFAGIYPNANYMVSNNLLTRTATPAHGNLAEHDREALRVVEGWLADERFAAQRPRIEAMRSRLQQFVR